MTDSTPPREKSTTLRAGFAPGRKSEDAGDLVRDGGRIGVSTRRETARLVDDGLYRGVRGVLRLYVQFEDVQVEASSLGLKLCARVALRPSGSRMLA
ncbi:hypothetical protein [Streptomyces sp. NPDC059272]|uniref:hypothetical protein n=1 Tax=Streptomyces sp. NPDC059272 TaxID=3346800 RepID=UPI0036B89093